MCGFSFAINWPDATATVRQLTEGILHRGDITDPLLTFWGNTAMCTRRLRIVDGDHAIQPQFSFDGRLVVAFNGELYNHEALRDELSALGVRFRTESDTEVLANALWMWGHKALQRFSGMYAFVALDTSTREFLAARDPFGIKPLYLIQSGTSFLFCSEMRPLLDIAADGDVLLLPPGHVMSATVCGRYKSPIRPTTSAWRPNCTETLDGLLSEAVRSHIPPDLPFATMFSGGIDSTLVAHYARQFRPEAPGYFIGGETAPDYPFAAEYADRTGFDLRLVPFEPDSEQAFSLIDQAVAFTESFEPNLVRGAVCSLVAAQRMHQDGFRVALCGEGADELFCGYSPLELTFQEGNAKGRPVRDECLGLMHRVSLQRVDRCSMRHQLEMRVPFLDPAVAEFALSLDAGALVRDVDGVPVGKAALRDIYDLHPTLLPRAIRDRSKVPLGDGCGLNVSPQDSAWKKRFDAEISDRDFREGQMAFAPFSIQSKEELFYIRKLSRVMDVFRVPHLRDRAWILSSLHRHREKLRASAL